MAEDKISLEDVRLKAESEVYPDKLLAHYQNSLDISRDEHLHVFSNVFSYGHASTKAAIILNGGAAIALLAFIGHALTNGEANSIFVAAELSKAMSWLFYGAGFGGAIAGFAYLAQVFFVRANWCEEKRSPPTSSSFVIWLNKNSRLFGNIFMATGVLSGISSYVCFIRAGLLISDTASYFQKLLASSF